MKLQCIPTANRAFSLVELSIVLVILGLLVGGVLSGQSLIRASELRSITTDSARYSAAIQSFRDKYFALPGDFNLATRFWNRQDASGWCSSNGTATVVATGVCDGDGDGAVNPRGSTANATQERFQVWRHLASAGLIEGTYTGLPTVGYQGPFSGTGDQTDRTNVPVGKLSSSLWFTDGDIRGHYLLLGGFLSASLPSSPILTPEEAWNIDVKVDDGKPNTGKVSGTTWSSNPNCADSFPITNSSNYRLNDKSVMCTIAFFGVY